jgi:peptidoglycan/LPS O-acetylase OafA/YrhL
MQGSNPRFPLFDSLRAMAALGVFVFHLPVVAQMSLDNPVRPYLLVLNIGIAVFFLISGFLLYRPFAQARYDGDKAPATVLYAERRALRIVPAYWVALVFVVLLLGKAGESPTSSPVFTPEGVLRYFGFLQIYDSDTLLGGISAAWTLCVEVTFYAMLPLWAVLLRRVPFRSRRGFLRSELLALAALFVVGVTWTAVAAPSSEDAAAAFSNVTLIEPGLYVLPAFLDHFALGMAIAVFSVALADRARQPNAIGVIDRAPWLPWLVAALAFVAIANLDKLTPENWTLRTVSTHVLQGVFAFALLLPAVFGDPDRGFVRRLLANRMLLWVGLVSYGLYLWHVAVNVKLVEWGVLDSLGSVGYIAVALAVALLAATASFYGVERHALRLGRRLSHRRRSQDADIRMRDLSRHERAEPGVP